MSTGFCAEMIKFLFCTNGNYSVCTIFRLEKEKKLCYHIYNKEEIKQQSKKEKSDNQNQIICDRNDKIQKLKFQKQDPKNCKIKSLQTHKRK